MELTRTDAVFNRIAMVLLLCRNKCSWNDLKLHGEYFLEYIKNTGERINQRDPPGVHKGGGALTSLGTPPASWPPWSSTDLNANSIYSRSGRKKTREKDSSRFTIWSHRQALISLGRADPESIRGSREGNLSPSSSSTFLHHQFMMLTAVRE